MVAGHRPLALSVVVEGSRRFGRVFVYREIATRVDRIAFLARLNDEFFGKLAVGESGQAQHTCRVRCSQIAGELICGVMKERLRLILTESAHFPNDLMLAGRGFENKVWRRDFG